MLPPNQKIWGSDVFTCPENLGVRCLFSSTENLEECCFQFPKNPGLKICACCLFSSTEDLDMLCLTSLPKKFEDVVFHHGASEGCGPIQCIGAPFSRFPHLAVSPLAACGFAFQRVARRTSHVARRTPHRTRQCSKNLLMPFVRLELGFP
jgi:hypothetical protein